MQQNSRSYERESPNRALFSEQLAEYLWENYIECVYPTDLSLLAAAVWLLLTTRRTNDASRIFFMGVGDAFLGLANLLINKGLPFYLPFYFKCYSANWATN